MGDSLVKETYPALSYSPTSHNFGDKCEGETDSTTFEIWNSGSGTLTYSLSESCDWVGVHPTSESSTGEHDTITVDIDTTGLSEDSHTCDISISSNDGSGTFTATVNVVPSPEYGVDLTADPTEKTVNTNINATYVLTVTNTGTVTDNYTLSVDNMDNAAVASLDRTTVTDLPSGASATVLLNVTDETNGTYNVSVTATSQGNASVSDTVMTKTRVKEIVPPRPQLVTYTITNRTITPPQTTEIDVEFSEKVAWIMTIEGSSVIYDWTGTSTDPAPNTWDGTYEVNSTVVPDGDYYVNVSGTNITTGLSVINNTEIITVTTPDTTPPVISNVQAL
ncbi:MAG: hypothetical protein U9O85_03075 [Euryarchaeota archaeon]|nr:hypothetical protein [Euryarchaeota archaeon]